MHVYVRHFSQDSTFDLFKFLSKIYFVLQNLSFKLGVGLICECGLCAGVYGKSFYFN